MYSWKKIFKSVLAHKKLFITAQILALLAVLASVPAPLLMPLLVDEVLLHKPGKLLAFIQELFGNGSPFFYTLIVLAMTLLLRGIYISLGILQSKIFHTISKNITAQIRQDVLTHLKKVSMSEYEMLGSGKVASRLVSDINTIDLFLSSSISKLLVSVLTLVGVSIVLLLIHWQLALFILILNPFVVLFSSRLAKKVSKLKKEENRAIEIFQNSLVETLELFEQIRAANKEEYFFGRLMQLIKDLKNRSIAFSYKNDAGVRLSFLVFLSGFELFRAAGIITVAYSDLSIGLMMAIFGYLWVMMTPIQDIINIQYAKRSADMALKRINELFTLQKEPEFPALKDPFAVSENVSITLEHVWFSYGEKKPVLKDITATIAAGKITALVGASGSGKTTLSRLLVGLYVPTKGDIFYNGVSMQEIGLKTIRQHVALVLQTPILFNDTVLFNLTLGKEYPEDKIKEALQMAQIYKVIEALPQGLDTVVGKGGARLSGGEKQRIAIARMILQDPKVVILDESTSAIDMETEKLLFCALKDFLRKRTTILIAHRPSTIEEADILLFLKDGEIVKKSRFEEYKRNFCIL
ncbi:ATP-binding cassette, subfamily C, bacterial [Nitratiruptor sp. YY08-26]|uniref:ABC transporter ATP-binding protein n=1 Tax=unclassified Nitratiruptor TaxID=2624044 RepID=UPI001916A329|nr:MULTISPECIES: ABC transporter ATP-binding protein [unclassified Nitratiruptor]BCD62050.1 ATP-binding cassette, subfamily C, bacterial [Nitratiruptor sp. YY08-13]BCD65986.1 ATP-binding cassette, subfamily C, bacterial [Nitratiruptor sp. YY08-26]